MYYVSNLREACHEGCCLIGFDNEIDRSSGSVYTIRPMYQILPQLGPNAKPYVVESADYDRLAAYLEWRGDGPPIFL